MSAVTGRLAGRRVLVTRTREQGEKTAAEIEARGGIAVLLPTIELVPPPDAAAVQRALARVRSYGWVVLTSTNGVDFAFRAGLRAGDLEGVKVAAIGPATARALDERGRAPDLVASDSRAEGLAASLLAAMGAGESVLLLRARVARDVLPDALRARGHAVDDVAVYETRPASGDLVTRVLAELGEGRVDAVTFTSASTVDGFVELAGGRDGAEALLARTVVASIGPITGAALARHRLRVDCAAREATLASLLDAIEERLGGPAGADG